MLWHDEKWGDSEMKAAYIHRLAVKDGFHNQGMGEQIINLAAEAAAAKGKTFLRLDCSNDNTSLCNYYEGLGFTRVSTKITMAGDYSAALYERLIPV